MRSIIAGALALMAWALPASAQTAGWLFQTVFEVQSLNATCLAAGGATSVHILGVTGEADLSDVERNRIAADLTDILSSRLGVRVTKADTLGVIQGASSGADSAELGRLVAETSRADVTVLVSPLARQGRDLDAEVRLWTRDASGIACAPSFRVTIPLEAADPICAQAFGTARATEDPGRLEAFAEFLPHCAEAETARSMAREMRAAADAQARLETCSAEFQETLALGTVAAFDLFTERWSQCPEYQTALTIRETVRDREICEAAYSEATLTDTEEGYADYARRHAACPQAAAARTRLDALRAAPSAPQALAPQAPAPQAPVQTVQPNYGGTPSCDELWYQRNAIFDAAGYCFKSARAQRFFSNAGCTGGLPTGAAAREVDRLVALERRLGCR